MVEQSRQFMYSQGQTPYIHGIVPSAAVPGDEVQVLGSYRWYRLNIQSYGDDPRQLVRTVQIGPARYDSLLWMPHQHMQEHAVTCDRNPHNNPCADFVLFNR